MKKWSKFEIGIIIRDIEAMKRKGERRKVDSWFVDIILHDDRTHINTTYSSVNRTIMTSTSA